MTNQELAVRTLWNCFSRSAFLEARPLLADSFFADWPVSRERFESPESFLQVQIEYPGTGTITVLELLETGNRVFTHCDVHWNGEHATVLSLFEFDDQGLICKLTEWWPETYEPPAGREHLTSRI